MLRFYQENEQQTVLDYRHDPRMQQKVVALASRLQNAHQETLTTQQMQEIGVEVGLEPAFIQQAISQLTELSSQETTAKAKRQEFFSLVAAYGLSLGWGLLSFLHIDRGRIYESPPVNASWLTASTLLVPLLLSVFAGFLVGKKKNAFAVGLFLVLCLAPSFYWSGQHSAGEDILGFWRGHGAGTLAYLLGGGLISGSLSRLGANLRLHFFPPSFVPERSASGQATSRAELLKLLFTLQNQLESQQQRYAFLSVDVVGSQEMKRKGPQLAVEYSFTQYREWIEQIVAGLDGRMQIAAGDGVMCLFPTESAALHAARRIQEGIDGFNAHHNRLPLPFRLRCGVNAGEVALEAGTPIGHLQSPVIDRAAALQKQAEPGNIVVSEELQTVAEQELGPRDALTQVPGEATIRWRSA